MSYPVAFYKTMQLGEFLKGPEAIELASSGPQFEAASGQGREVQTGYGPQMRFEFVLRSCIQRSASTSESFADFLGRRLQFAIDFAQVCGRVPSSRDDTTGTLAFLLDVSQIHATGSGVSAASTTVDIAGSFVDFFEGERWYITDGSNWELLTIAADGSSTTLSVEATQYAYASGAVIFRPTWWLERASFVGSLKIPGGEDTVAHSVARDMELRFASVEDPGYQ